MHTSWAHQGSMGASKPFSHPWTLPSLGAYLFLGLETSFRRYTSQIPGPQLFAMFLLRSYCDTAIKDKSLQLAMLEASADKGYVPAQAVLSRVYESYDVSLESPQGYLVHGASSGSLYALLELAVLDPNLAQRARTEFKEKTGYNQLFSPLRHQCPPLYDATDIEGNTRLHHLAATGSQVALREALLDEHMKKVIDLQNQYGETALYKACLTGCEESLFLLCQCGADASLPSSLNKLTCLHWLFNFPSNQIDRVLSILLRSGADINAVANSHPSSVISDHQFPFRWPLGTPLHFAVHTHNHTAVGALMSHGADASIRDIRDPYLTDINVRQMHVHGTAETGESSQPDHIPLGFTPVDLAAALHDAESLELLGQHTQLHMTPDEEGYTPFHRLSHFRTARTSNGLRFWYPAFRGNAERHRLQISKTIRALQSLGGDINRLTNTPDRPALQGVSGLSPLMIAVTKADCEFVHQLLQAGADVNQINRDGVSALMLLPHSSDPHVTPGSLLGLVRSLLSAGANINLQSPDGMSALGAAAAADSMDCVQALVNAEADLSLTQRGLNIVAGLVHQNGYVGLLLPPAPKSVNEAEAREQALFGILGTVCATSHDWAHRVDMDNGSLLHYVASAGLTDCARLLVEAGFDKGQIRKLHFNGQVPSYYNSIPGRMDGQGTPLQIAAQREATHLSSTRSRLTQQGQPARQDIATYSLANDVSRQRLRCTKVQDDAEDTGIVNVQYPKRPPHGVTFHSWTKSTMATLRSCPWTTNVVGQGVIPLKHSDILSTFGDSSI